jgi:propanol-preferring alcohol dehydrogenase
LFLVRLAAKEITLNTYELVAREVSLKDSTGSLFNKVAKVLNLITDRKIQPLLEEIPFSDIANGLDRRTKVAL